jgi:hypothetical protein
MEHPEVLKSTTTGPALDALDLAEAGLERVLELAAASRAEVRAGGGESETDHESEAIEAGARAVLELARAIVYGLCANAAAVQMRAAPPM